jgi:hypothetical protein
MIRYQRASRVFALRGSRLKMRGGAYAFVSGPVRTQLRQIQAAYRLPFDPGQTSPPDFVGIGAQRCGTSWWHSLIEQHPQVTALGLRAKELHFFDNLWRVPVITDDVTRYATHFRRRPGHLAGEWTPRYMFDPWAVPALYKLAPSVKLIVMLRDPIARLESGLRHELQVAGDLSPDVVTAACTRGMYAQQLTPMLSYVPRDQLLVLQFEQCVADADRQLGRTFDFLGISADAVKVSAGRRNASAVVSSLPAALADSVRLTYRLDAEQLKALFPDDIDLDLWTRLR